MDVVWNLAAGRVVEAVVVEDEDVDGKLGGKSCPFGG